MNTNTGIRSAAHGLRFNFMGPVWQLLNKICRFCEGLLEHIERMRSELWSAVLHGGPPDSKLIIIHMNTRGRTPAFVFTWQKEQSIIIVSE